MSDHKTTYPVINLVETGNCLKRRSRQAGYSVKEITEYLGVTPQAIYKWMRGETLPSIDNLLGVARFLGVSMEDLLVYEDQEVSRFIWGFKINCFLNYMAFKFFGF